MTKLGEALLIAVDRIKQLEAALAARDARIGELETELSDVTVWGQACDDVRSELAYEVEQLRAQLAAAQRWQPVKLGTHEIRKPNGELQGHMTLTPVRLSWLDALDNHFEIVWGTEYRLCRRADAAQETQEGGE
jgi:hypothetical protein